MELMKLWRIARFLGLGPPVVVADPPKPNTPPQRSVRIGLIGASKVATYAIIWPSRLMPHRCEVTAVAARDERKAYSYAKQHNIQRSYGDYDDLINDSEVDAIYIGLPNGLHGSIARRALQAGKHVLCEKPFSANEQEAVEVWGKASTVRPPPHTHGAKPRDGLVMREAMHVSHHPLAHRLIEQVSPLTTPLGTIQRIDIDLLIPKWCFPLTDIRFDGNLAGGAMMDAGAYCAHMTRHLAAASLDIDPTSPHFKIEIDSAAAKLAPGSDTIDGAMIANWSARTKGKLVQGRFHASLMADCLLLPKTDVTVWGSEGSLKCRGFIVPFFGHRIELDLKDKTKGGTRRVAETAYGSNESTYYYQLDNFLTEIELGTSKDSNPKSASDSILNMRLIDDTYRAAGLKPRQPTVLQ